jgi:hypothetical protein
VKEHLQERLAVPARRMGAHARLLLSAFKHQSLKWPLSGRPSHVLFEERAISDELAFSRQELDDEVDNGEPPLQIFLFK